MESFLRTDNRPPDREAIEAILKDYGFYHNLSDVKRMYAEYINNKKYGYSGGVLDQPETYWADMDTMKALAIYVEHFAPLANFTDKEPIFDKLRRGASIV